MRAAFALALLAAGCTAGGDDRGSSSPTPTPVPESEVVVVSSGPALDYDAAAFERSGDGATVIVFSRFETAVFAGTLVATSSLDGTSFSTPAVLDVGLADPLQAGPAALVAGGTSWLYFMAGDSGANLSRLYRSPLAATFGTAQMLTLADPFAGMLAWPHPVALPGGGLALAYDHYGQGPYLAFGDDGLSWGAQDGLGTGVQGRAAGFDDGEGTVALTYQNGNASDMIAYVRLGTEGDFTDRVPITDAANVHDPVPFTRIDGDVDLYYIHTALGQFSIYRRKLSPDGDFGVEELVVEESFGGTTQPRPHRLADGRILLTFTHEITNQTDYDVAFAILDSDS